MGIFQCYLIIWISSICPKLMIYHRTYFKQSVRSTSTHPPPVLLKAETGTVPDLHDPYRALGVGRCVSDHTSVLNWLFVWCLGVCTSGRAASLHSRWERMIPLSVQWQEGGCEKEGGGRRGTVPSAQERILRQTNFREEHTKAEALGVSSLNTVGVHVPLGKSFVAYPSLHMTDL